MKTLSRSNGYSAVSAAAYRSGTHLREAEDVFAARQARIDKLEKALPQHQALFTNLSEQLAALQRDSDAWNKAFNDYIVCKQKLDACAREAKNTGNHNYAAKASGVLHSEITAPDDAPHWVRDRQTLWNEAERSELRTDSVVAREIVVALPHELCHVRQVETVRKFSQWMCERYNVVVDASLHASHKNGDDRNFHAHILFTTREVGAEGFGAKTRLLDRKATGSKEVTLMRETWATMCNDALADSGNVVRIDHQSLKDRGSDRIPNIKIGKAATAMERKGVKTMRGDLWREIEAKNIANDNERSNWENHAQWVNEDIAYHDEYAQFHHEAIGYER